MVPPGPIGESLGFNRPVITLILGRTWYVVAFSFRRMLGFYVAEMETLFITFD